MIRPIIFSLILFAIFSVAIYLLWQRQPKTDGQETILSETSSKPVVTDANSILELKNPRDNQVVTTASIKVSGRAKPNSYVVLLNFAANEVEKTNKEGGFEKEIKLEDGLNLLQVSALSVEKSASNSAILKEEAKQTLTIYKAKNLDNGQSVFSGSVKSLFDTLITITSASGEKTVKTLKSTNLILPQDKDAKEASASVKNIRIGDYVIAQGDIQTSGKNEESLDAKKVEVLRSKKPRLEKEFSSVKILAPVKNNLFSSKNNTDGKVMEFFINKNSVISVDGKTGKNEEIAKDKSALVVFHKDDDDRIADLVYIIP